MKMELKLIRNGILSCVLGFAVVNAAYSDGYRNPQPTAEGIGKSGINMVFVDDASAISYNPANLTLLEKGSAVVSATLARQENTYDSILSTGSVDSDDPWVVLPNLYAAMPVGDNGLTVGLGITTPYGQGIKWDSTDVYNPFIPISLYDAEIKVINFGPSVAFKIGDRVSVGVGADIYYSELKFKALVGDVANAPGPPTGGGEVDKADDVGYGGNMAVTWQVTDRQRLAFTYRSEVKLDYDGDFDVTPSLVPFPAPGSHPFVNSDFGLEVTYPTIIGAGYGIELTDTIRVEANFEWAEWSVNDSQDADLGVNNIVLGGPLSIPQDWDDSIRVGVGGDWQFDENWVVRAGYVYLESPIPDSTLSPTLPDADRHALSLGLGYTTGAHAIDVAYTYSIFEDRSPSFPENQAYPGDYDIDSDLFGLTYSYSF